MSLLKLDVEMLQCRSVAASIQRHRCPLLFSKSRPTTAPLRAKRDSDVVYGDPLTRFIDGLLGRGGPPVESLFEGEKLEGLSLEQLKEKLVEGVTMTRWFVTGRVDYRLFSSEKFRFKDPSVEVFSIEEYAKGVSRLFDEDSEIDIVETKIVDGTVEMVWRLKAVLKLPLKPKIKAYYVTTVFRTNEQGLICEQLESFSIPEWELVLSIFFPNFGTPPAPPVQKSEG